MRFFENPANDTKMYSEHFQQLKRGRLQEKFYVAASLIRNVFWKTFVFLISEGSYIYKTKLKKRKELNLNIESGTVVFFTIFTSRKNYRITCAIPCSEKRDRTHPITSLYPVLVEKICI